MEIKLRYRFDEKFADGHWENYAWETARFTDHTDAVLFVASLANEVVKANRQGRRLYVSFGPNHLKSGVIIESGDGSGIWVSVRRTGYIPRGVTTRDSFGGDVLGAARAVLQALSEPGRPRRAA